jgi:hypothetical protein
MIHFNFSIANPCRYQQFKDFWQKDLTVTKNKTLELGLYRYAWNLFEFALDLRWWGHDHAGPSLELGILGYTARIGIADRRHWNNTANTWE